MSYLVVCSGCRLFIVVPVLSAEHMGLPLVPAYLELCNADKMNITTGVNYASGAAGILPQTGTKTVGEFPCYAYFL